MTGKNNDRRPMVVQNKNICVGMMSICSVKVQILKAPAHRGGSCGDDDDDDDSQSANRAAAACRIGSFLGRVAVRQTARTRRRRLLTSSTGERTINLFAEIVFDDCWRWLRYLVVVRF